MQSRATKSLHILSHRRHRATVPRRAHRLRLLKRKAPAKVPGCNIQSLRSAPITYCPYRKFAGVSAKAFVLKRCATSLITIRASMSSTKSSTITTAAAGATVIARVPSLELNVMWKPTEPRLSRKPFGRPDSWDVPINHPIHLFHQEYRPAPLPRSPMPNSLGRLNRS